MDGLANSVRSEAKCQTHRHYGERRCLFKISSKILKAYLQPNFWVSFEDSLFITDFFFVNPVVFFFR